MFKIKISIIVLYVVFKCYFLNFLSTYIGMLFFVITDLLDWNDFVNMITNPVVLHFLQDSLFFLHDFFTKVSTEASKCSRPGKYPNATSMSGLTEREERNVKNQWKRRNVWYCFHKPYSDGIQHFYKAYLGWNTALLQNWWDIVSSDLPKYNWKLTV